MTQAQQHIIGRLKRWNRVYEGIEIRYAYDIEANFHIVEIGPEAIRRGNPDYKEEECEFWLEFLELYSCENLLIDAPSKVNDMSNLLYTNIPDEEA